MISFKELGENVEWFLILSPNLRKHFAFELDPILSNKVTLIERAIFYISNVWHLKKIVACPKSTGGHYTTMAPARFCLQKRVTQTSDWAKFSKSVPAVEKS